MACGREEVGQIEITKHTERDISERDLAVERGDAVPVVRFQFEGSGSFRRSVDEMSVGDKAIPKDPRGPLRIASGRVCRSERGVVSLCVDRRAATGGAERLFVRSDAG